MFGLRPQEMLFIAVIILFFFGARKIPEMAKGVAEGIKTFKKSMKEDEGSEPKNSKEKEKPA